MTRLHIDRLRGGDSEEGPLSLREEEALEPWGPGAALAEVGRRHVRQEAFEKVTGRARYSSDVQRPGQLYARVLRSPHPHARIRRIDASRAEAIPGVHAVLTSSNALGIAWYETSRLFDCTVRFVGDEVAAVAAESEEIAEDALRAIDVEYERLPFVLDADEALADGAPRVHPDGNLAEEPTIYERGSAAAGLSEAEVVIERSYETGVALHNSLEPHGCTAEWADDELTIWESTQGIFDVRQQVAAKLELPEHRVRIIKEHMGGGFGAKQIAWKHAVIASLLSRETGRPVQLMLDREAENLAVGNRNPTRQRVRLGARRDGTLTAIEVEVVQSTGAYSVGGEASNTTGLYERLYRCPNVRTERRVAFTNTGPAVAFRAPGYVEAALALESAMDELARELGIDPLELRLRNYAEDDQKRELPYSSPRGLRICYERVAEAFGWREHRRPRGDGSKRRGIGIAAHDWGGAGFAPAYAWVKVNEDATVDVVTGTQDIGTGTRTGLAAVAAEELGIPIGQVVVHLGDTAVGPYAPVSSGSATQATVGPAVRAAAADARRQILALAARLLECGPEDLAIRDGSIHAEGEGGRSVSVAEVLGQIAPHMILGRGARGPNPDDCSVRTFGVQCAEVEVDVETGEVSVLRLVAAHECGRVVNPRLVESQIIGGMTQGIGFGILEEQVVDGRLGVPLNANLEEYRIPTAADVPPMEVALVDEPDPRANPTGAKGIGEPPIIPTAPAIANAIFDATGVRLRGNPITRAALLDALGGALQADRPPNGQDDGAGGGAR